MSIFKVFRVVKAMREISALVDEAMAAIQDGKLTEDEARVLIIKIYAILKVI